MPRPRHRRVVIATTLAMLAIVAPGVVGGPAGAGTPCVAAPGVNDKCETWAMTYVDGEKYSNTHADLPVKVISSPDGKRLFMSSTTLVDGSPRTTVVALDSRRGSTLWVAHGKSNPPTVALAMALSPNGSEVFITGYAYESLSINSSPYYLYLTTAYSARSGRLLWSKRYVGLGGQANAGTALVASPDSHTVYVTGLITIPGPFQRPPANISTLALNARTGKVRWAARFNGESGVNQPTSIALSRRGDRLFITGLSQYRDPSPTPVFRYVTLAYSTRHGKELWEAYYNGYRDGNNQANALAVDPRGRRVFVTGFAQYAGSVSAPIYRYQTIAYGASSGRTLWRQSYVAAKGESDAATTLAVSPRGDRVYVTGASTQPSSVAGQQTPLRGATSTIGYDAATGHRRWLTVSQPQGLNTAGTALAVSKTGTVYVGMEVGVAGPIASGPALAALDGRRGNQKWIARYDLRDPTVEGVTTAPVSLTLNPRSGAIYELNVVRPPAGVGQSTACPIASQAMTINCTAEGSYPLVLAYAR